ncbi:glycosyltransferase [Pseudaminobacter soli (ex Li et al. 2025)]|uniref:Glycosyl transferase family 2 n=1 Tax=Pseudaminobacter soli (ex Li et al. 2025) TaxID=1295366 RepID=A0A2P7RUB5_9HYPH|nr:glycosyltransferase [Mesorhizobium soli]PSJ53786.1 glycosyl transferase family 2 [Mesorhizobium soli]
MTISFRPIKVASVDLREPLRPISMVGSEHGDYGSVLCLIRAGAKPLRVIEFDVKEAVVSVAELRERIGEINLDEGEKLPLVTKRISIVIATRDRAESLARCLDSLCSQSLAAHEVIVVDNAPSSSQTADLVATRCQSDERIRYIREDVPGLGRAHNTGVSVATGDIILFTDDDVAVDRHWVAAIASNFQDSDVGCVTGLILPAELETRAQIWTELHGGFGKGVERRVFDLGSNRPKGSLFPFTAGQFGSGANMAFTMNALKSIGGFDPALGAGTLARGGDDLSSFYSVIIAGFKLVYEPAAIVWHYHRRSDEGMRRQAYGYGMGLGAYLTKIIIDNPSTALRLLRVLPAGLLHMVGPFAQKNQRLPDDYPRSLVWQERLGIVAGILGYLKSRTHARRIALRTPLPIYDAAGGGGPFKSSSGGRRGGRHG